MDGQLIAGRYRLIRVIGKGGTGVVYLAEDRNLQKEVVLKQITSQLNNRPGIRNEVDILKNLHHSNLPQVYDFFQSGQQVFTVFEFIHGHDLTAWLRKDGIPSRLSEEVLRSWLWQLCTVLEYLHSQNPAIIHSDIKPGNIMITPEGRAMLIDFNISFLSSQAVKGYSNWYASPEQVRQARMLMDSSDILNTKLDARSDLYSLAATFYHLICGRNPVIDGRNLPLCSMNLPYSRDLLALLDRAMEQNPTKRYRSARQMRDALDHFQRYDRAFQRRLWQQLAVFVCSVALITAGVVCVLTGRRVERVQRFEDGYQAAESAFSANDPEKMENAGREVLEDTSLADVMRFRTAQTGELNAIVGEGYYLQGRYTLAAKYYETAYQWDQRADYLLREITALARCGERDKAQELLDELQTGEAAANCAGVILKAELLCQDGKFDLALEQIEETTQPSDPELQLRLLETGAYVARAGHNWKQAAGYLSQCYQLTGSGTYLQEQGTCSYLVASETADELERLSWYEKAVSCYAEYNERFYPTDETKLQEALMYYHAGDWQRAETQLEELTDSGTTEAVLYRAWMYLAFLTSEYRNAAPDAIKEMCEQAIQHRSQVSKSEKLRDEADWKYLLELADSVGLEDAP